MAEITNRRRIVDHTEEFACACGCPLYVGDFVIDTDADSFCTVTCALDSE